MVENELFILFPVDNGLSSYQYYTGCDSIAKVDFKIALQDGWISNTKYFKNAITKASTLLKPHPMSFTSFSPGNLFIGLKYNSSKSEYFILPFPKTFSFNQSCSKSANIYAMPEFKALFPQQAAEAFV